MKLSICTAILKMLTRPTVGNGVLWSLSVHTVTGVATFAWCLWLWSSQPAWLSHERQVVQLQISAPQPPETAVPLELFSESVTALEPAALLPQVVELAKQDQALPPERLQAEPERVADPPSRTQRESKPKQSVPTSARVEPHKPELRKHQRELPPPVTMVAVQIPNAEQKRADMSGNVPPNYPPVAIRNGYEGTVLLRLHVAATGQVERVEIIQSSGHGVLDQAAKRAVLTWRGQPATYLGRATTSVETLPVRFRL